MSNFSSNPDKCLLASCGNLGSSYGWCHTCRNELRIAREVRKQKLEDEAFTATPQEKIFICQCCNEAKSFEEMEKDSRRAQGVRKECLQCRGQKWYLCLSCEDYHLPRSRFKEPGDLRFYTKGEVVEEMKYNKSLKGEGTCARCAKGGSRDD